MKEKLQKAEAAEGHKTGVNSEERSAESWTANLFKGFASGEKKDLQQSRAMHREIVVLRERCDCLEKEITTTCSPQMYPSMELEMQDADSTKGSALKR